MHFNRIKKERLYSAPIFLFNIRSVVPVNESVIAALAVAERIHLFASAVFAGARSVAAGAGIAIDIAVTGQPAENDEREKKASDNPSDDGLKLVIAFFVLRHFGILPFSFV